MNNDKYLHIVKNCINNMPSLPIGINKIKDVCYDPKSSSVDIYKLIILDPVLIAKVIKLFNSLYYDASEKVVSLAKIIIILGINTVKNLVINSADINNVNKKDSLRQDNAGTFWHHSFCTAVTAKIFALKTGKEYNEAEEYFMAGMLHDIGKIPILACFPSQYKAIADNCKESLLDTEEQVFGFNHCAVGKMIAKQWVLGGKMELVVSEHHGSKQTTESKYKEIINMVSVADYFINKMGFGFFGAQAAPSDALFKSTGITEDIFKDSEKTILSELEKAKGFLCLKG